MIVTALRLACPPAEPETVMNWLNELVRKVDMQVLIPATAIRCEDAGNEGVTGTIVICTSHASIHVWDKCDEPFAQIDLFSCKTFEPQTVLDHVAALMAPGELRYRLIDRNP